VRWTSAAADDLEAIVLYIRQEKPETARRIARKVFTEIRSLSAMSLRGRPGIVQGTRELVLSPLPYIAVYEVLNNEISILRIRHAAQDWP